MYIYIYVYIYKYIYVAKHENAAIFEVPLT